MENNMKNDKVILELVHLIISSVDDKKLKEVLNDYHENDIAEALERLNREERQKLYRILGIDKVSEIFSYLDDVGKYIDELELENAADIIEKMDADDAVDVLEEVDESTREKLIKLIDNEAKQDIDLICSYDEDEIGSQMTTNFIAIQKGLTVKQAMKSMIQQADENDNISTIYVVLEYGRLYGAMDLKDLIKAREYMDLEAYISTCIRLSVQMKKLMTVLSD